jgi:hypothetical protein
MYANHIVDSVRPSKEGTASANSRRFKSPCPRRTATLESIFLTVVTGRTHCQASGLALTVSWRRSQVVRQRSAKPSSPVRIRAAPLQVSACQQAAGGVSSPCFPGDSRSSTQEHAILSSRQEPTDNDQKRPPTATENATWLVPEDPDLATVIEAWDRLPAALRAGIVAMVKAARS